MTNMQVFLIAAMTADGFIAKDTEEASTKWTSKEDAVWFNKCTKAAGVVVLGRKTYETIPEKFRPLPERINLVLSSKGKSSLQKNDLQTNKAVELNMSPKELVATLKSFDVDELAVCGGSSIYTQFLASGLVDRLFLTVEPILFGEGITLFSESFGQGKKLELQEVHKLSQKTVVLEYELKS